MELFCSNDIGVTSSPRSPQEEISGGRRGLGAELGGALPAGRRSGYCAARLGPALEGGTLQVVGGPWPD